MFSPRVAWALALGCVTWQLVVRGGWLFDIAGHNDAATGPLLVGGAVVIVGLVTTHVFISIERGPPRLLLVAMVLLTFAPAPMFGTDWPAITGLVGSAILLTVRSPWAWALCGAVLGADALAYWLVAEGGGAEVSGRVLVHVNVTLTLFVVVRLARLIQKTHDARHAAAHALVQVEKQSSARWLRSALGSRLGELLTMTGRISADTQLPQQDVKHVAETARLAAETARRAVAVRSRAHMPHLDDSEDTPPEDHAVSWALSVILTFTFGAVTAANLVWQGGATTVTWGITIGVALSAGALHLYHGTPRRDGGTPRWWPWTLAAQVVIVVSGVWVAGEAVLLPYATLVAGGAATRLRGPWLWLLPAAAFTMVPVIAAELAPSWSTWRSVYLIGALGTGIVTLYAVCHLPWIATLLHQTRAEFARVAVIAERSSFARDVHDLLGLHLSAMVLNAELAVRTLEQDSGATRARLDTVRLCAERALSDLRSIHDVSEAASTTREVAEAASLLRTVGIQVGVDAPESASGRADQIAAIVVREASTNIVRHSRAERCNLRLRVDGGGNIELDIINDGADVAGREPHSGTGLGNLTARVEEAGGRLTTTRTETTFRLRAQIPAHPSAATRDLVARNPPRTPTAT